MFLTPNSAVQFFKKKFSTDESTGRLSLAVLIIDMQKYFLEDVEKEERRRVINSQKEVLRYCATYDVPVVVVEYSNSGKTITPLMKRVKKVKRWELVEKSNKNGFHNPELEYILKSWGAKKILLMGIYASACVLATAEGGISKGFKVATSENLIADSADSQKETKKSLPWYKRKAIYKKNHLELVKSLI